MLSYRIHTPQRSEDRYTQLARRPRFQRSPSAALRVCPRGASVLAGYARCALSKRAKGRAGLLLPSVVHIYSFSPNLCTQISMPPRLHVCAWGARQGA